MNKIKIECKTCKKIFLVHPYRKDTALFCSRSCLGKSRIGSKNSCWRGGKINRKDGYVLVYSPNHPFSDKSNYVFEHRVVMENMIKRFLRPEEKVHHKNGVRNDNRIDNLELLPSQSEHARKHYILDGRWGKDWTGLKMSITTKKKMSVSARKAWKKRKLKFY